MSKCVVVASAASRKSIAIARSVSEVLGLSVVGVAHKPHPFVLSVYFKKRYILNTDRQSPEWVEGVLSVATSNGCTVVVPVDFVDTYTFSRYRNMFNEKGIVVVAPTYDKISIASNKVKIYEQLKDVAAFPRQVYVAQHQLDAIYGLSPPLVVKGIGDASSPSFYIDHDLAAEEALKRVPCIVQEYVEGVARGYYAVAFNGEPLLEFTHQRVIEYTPIGGASLAATGYVDDPTLVVLGRRAVERLSWTGVIMVETRYVDEMGEYFIIEINPKFWGSIDLPVSLGYHFPAVAVSLYLYGIEKTRDLISKLKVRKGSFSWVLDGFRYIARSPCIWLHLARTALKNPMNSDVQPIDGARDIVQFIYALKRLGREKREWFSYIGQSSKQMNVWVKRFNDVITSEKKILIMDLDGTLIDLDVDWSNVRERLYRDGYIYRWETINRALSRLWLENIKRFVELSRKLEKVELEALTSSRPLVSNRILKDLSRHFTMCVATKQSVKAAMEILKKLGVETYVSCIVGRDSGVNPVKRNLYKLCLDTVGGGKALVLDDGAQYVVDAYRCGLVPIHISRNIYVKLRVQRLGIPSTSTEKALKMVRSALGFTE